MHDTDLVQYEVDGHTARIWLNRPEKKNAFNLAMIAKMLRSFDAADDNPAVRVIILRGRGGTLCAGMDLAEVMETGRRVETQFTSLVKALIPQVAAATA